MLSPTHPWAYFPVKTAAREGGMPLPPGILSRKLPISVSHADNLCQYYILYPNCIQIVFKMLQI